MAAPREQKASSERKPASSATARSSQKLAGGRSCSGAPRAEPPGHPPKTPTKTPSWTPSWTPTEIGHPMEEGSPYANLQEFTSEVYGQGWVAPANEHQALETCFSPRTRSFTAIASGINTPLEQRAASPLEPRSGGPVLSGAIMQPVRAASAYYLNLMYSELRIPAITQEISPRRSGAMQDPAAGLRRTRTTRSSQN